MSWDDYEKLFDRLLPGVVARLDPERDYWPSSPHSPLGDRSDLQNPRWGDAHLWDVWHGRKPFEWYRTCEHRFNSEFGFQSFPEPRTVAAYTEPADRNITSYVMEHHQRSGIGNAAIMQYMLDWFRLPAGFDSTLWLTQILQGMAMKYAVEHWRRSMPRGMGTLYWQLNDCWPVASWSSIDYFRRWKALHYMARRFYAPLLVSAVEDAEKGTCEIWVSSDLLVPAEGRIRWHLTDLAGKVVRSGHEDAALAAEKSRRVTTLRLADEIAQKGARNVLLWIELSLGGKVVSSNLATFARPKHLELAGPRASLQGPPRQGRLVCRDGLRKEAGPLGLARAPGHPRPLLRPLLPPRGGREHRAGDQARSGDGRKGLCRTARDAQPARHLRGGRPGALIHRPRPRRRRGAAAAPAFYFSTSWTVPSQPSGGGFSTKLRARSRKISAGLSSGSMRNTSSKRRAASSNSRL